MILVSQKTANAHDSMPFDTQFVELETTGFSKHRDGITTISIARREDDQLTVTQYLAPTRDEEGMLLSRCLPKITARQCIVFHAGFLVPFLQARAEEKGLSARMPAPIDLLAAIKALKPFAPQTHYNRHHLAEVLSLPVQIEPNGGEVARLGRKLWKAYDPIVADRLRDRNLSHVLLLPGLLQYCDNWKHWLTREGVYGRLVLVHARHTGSFVVANFRTENIPPLFLQLDDGDFRVERDRAQLRIAIREGMITESMTCLFIPTEEFEGVTDRSGFAVPTGALLLHVEDRFLPEALLDLAVYLVSRAAPIRS